MQTGVVESSAPHKWSQSKRFRVTFLVVKKRSFRNTVAARAAGWAGCYFQPEETQSLIGPLWSVPSWKKKNKELLESREHMPTYYGQLKGPS